MNADDILHILSTTTGDARGVEGDDLLLARLHNESDKPAFWSAFHGAVRLLLRMPVDADQALSSRSPGRPKNDLAPPGGGSGVFSEPGAQLTQAASFLARVPVPDRPVNAKPLIHDLLESLGHSPKSSKSWPRHAAVLRLLTHLGAGDHAFWREQLRFWEGAIASADKEFLPAALDALVQAIRGVVATEGLKQQDFSSLFGAMSEVADFPALELYTALVEETRKERSQADFSPELLKQGVLKAWADFQAAPSVSSKAPSAQQLDMLKQVVMAWLKDEQLGQLPDISRHERRTPPWPASPPSSRAWRGMATAIAVEQRA